MFPSIFIRGLCTYVCFKYSLDHPHGYHQDRPLFYDCNHVKRLWLAVEQWLTRECGIDLKFCAKDVLFGVVEKDNFINSVICYARLYIMKCKIQDKQIAIEGFLNLIENEGVLYPI